jgi:DNA (cytosine-5)-methyltransferase 1|uniref:Cytosine specific methyltransferase n=1 Tax=Siphoviridae sp. ctq1q8 TaxID=2826467 RepID=A0A8S5MFH2_9CAUD|nr:MAG TPA: Cytosine specific methyltransferase [Siphoviridae sp. ctq1q8]
MSLTFIDFFAGIGGFRRGMELAGHKCVGFCEFDKFAVASYTSMHLITEEQRKCIENIEAPLKKNGASNYNKRQKEILKEEYRNGEWYADDVRRVDAASLPKADVWCFGFPCQDISIAGKQKGFKGNRSSLFFAVTRLLRSIEEESRPKYLFIENVKNLLSVNRGYDFARLLVELDEIGYDAEWQVLNSKDFGVPQNRERVFIIGHLRTKSTGEVFPLREADGVHNQTGQDGEVYHAARTLTAGGNDKWQGDYIITAGKLGSHQTDIVQNPNGIARSLKATDYKDPQKIEVKQIGNCMPTSTRKNPNQGRMYDPEGIAPCLNKMDGGGREPLVPVAGVYTNVSPNFLRPPLPELSKCLKANNHDAGILLGSKIRRLTPRECFRLQGWTDIYFDRAAMVNSNSQLYKQAGNGVTVPVIEAIAKQLNYQLHQAIYKGIEALKTVEDMENDEL